MSEDQSLQNNALMMMEQPFIQCSSYPFPESVDATTYSIMLYDLQQSQHQLHCMHAHLQQVQMQLAQAEAQVRHDHEIIVGMQCKITGLEALVQEHQMASRAEENQQASTTGASKNQKRRGGRGGRFSKFVRREQVPDIQQQQQPPQQRPAQFRTTFERPPAAFDVNNVPTQPRMLGNNANGEEVVVREVENFPASTTASTTQGQFNHDATLAGDEFAEKFAALFKKTDEFAERYTVPLGVEARAAVSETFKSYLLYAADNGSVLRFLDLDDYRFVAVAKVVNCFIVQTVLKVFVVHGLDATTDSEIAQLMEHVSPEGDPYSHGQDSVFAAIGSKVARLRDKPFFQNFYNKRMHENTEALLDIISPVIDTMTTQAWSDLAKIMTAAHNLALAMFSGPFEFEIRYNAVNPGPEGVGQKMAKVNITPTVRFRNVNSQSPDGMQYVQLGQVLTAQMH